VEDLESIRIVGTEFKSTTCAFFFEYDETEDLAIASASGNTLHAAPVLEDSFISMTVW
jgi:hypothetical protein